MASPLVPLLLASAVVVAVAMTRRPPRAATPPSPLPQPPPPPPPPSAEQQLADLLRRHQEIRLQFRLDRSVMRASDVRSVAAALLQAGRPIEAAELEAIALQLPAAAATGFFYGPRW